MMEPRNSPENSPGEKPGNDITPEPSQKVPLHGDLGVEYRDGRFVLRDEAFTVLSLACNWPDEDFRIGIDQPGVDLDKLVVEYLNPENPELLSPFFIAKDLPDILQDLIMLAVQTSEILPGDRKTKIEYINSLQSIGKGSIVINESSARATEGLELILAHEEHHRIYQNSSISDLSLLELGFDDAMKALENKKVDLVLEGVKVSNLKESLEFIDSRIATDVEEFWIQLLQPDDLSKSLLDGRGIGITGKMLKLTMQVCKQESNTLFQAAYQIAQRQSLEAIKEARKDLTSL